MNQQPNNSNPGFTLIELMLAMTFVSVLLITIALTIIQMGTIYNRGMTLKEVNQASRDIADDFRRSVASSPSFSVPETTISTADTTDYVIIANPDRTTIYGGRLCMGNYSYIWNTAKALQADTANNDQHITRYRSQSGQDTPVHFMKSPDVGKKYCQKDTDGELLNKSIVQSDAAEAVELLKPGDHSLGVLLFQAVSSQEANDTTTGQRLYTFNYTIGSGDVSAMNQDQTACLPPGNLSSNLTYCNVQKFSIVLRAGNGVN